MVIPIRKRARSVLIATLLFSTYAAYADKASPAICISADETDPRLLTVEYSGDAPVPCSTYYRKWHIRERIGTAEHTPGYCEALVDQVVANLAAQGFLCRRVDADEDLDALYRQYQ